MVGITEGCSTNGKKLLCNRKGMQKSGGGTALLHRKVKKLRVKEFDVGESEERRDVLATQVEYMNKCGRLERKVGEQLGRIADAW